MMNHKIKIASWNLCLGLPNKKDCVVEILKQNNIKICCLQETEICDNFPESSLNFGGYNLELEMNSEKKRTGIYLRSDMKYVRRKELEINDMHIVIVDLLCNVKFRIINVTDEPQNELA